MFLIGPAVKKLSISSESDLDLTMAAKGIFRDPLLQASGPVWSFPAPVLVQEVASSASCGPGGRPCRTTPRPCSARALTRKAIQLPKQ